MSNYRWNLRNMIDNDYLQQLIDQGLSDIDICIELSDMYGIPIRRQNVYYWRKQLARTPKRELLAERVLRTPSMHDGVRTDGNAVPTSGDCILVIPDLHAPYQHPDALDFLVEVRNAYNPDVVVNLGDETDGHAISFHNSDPNLDSAGVELHRARIFMHAFEQEFPQMLICDSNHGSLVYRRAKAHGIPVEMLKTYREILFPNGGGSGWHWKDSHVLSTELGEVLFRHQTTGSPKAAAGHEGRSVVAGHQHGKFEIEYGASSSRLYWGATAGCLVDNTSLAFAYGKVFPNKPILGCMVILYGVPTLIPMLLNSDGRWEGF